MLEQRLQAVVLLHPVNQPVRLPPTAHLPQALLGKCIQSDFDSHAKLHFSRSCSSTSRSLSAGITAAVVIGSIIGCIVCVVLLRVILWCVVCKKWSSPRMVIPPYQQQPI